MFKLFTIQSKMKSIPEEYHGLAWQKKRKKSLVICQLNKWYRESLSQLGKTTTFLERLKHPLQLQIRLRESNKKNTSAMVIAALQLRHFSAWTIKLSFSINSISILVVIVEEIFSLLGGHNRLYIHVSLFVSKLYS